MSENHPMVGRPFRKKAYEAVAAAHPFVVAPGKLTAEPGVSYLPGPINLHDCAAGVMAVIDAVPEASASRVPVPTSSTTPA